MATTISISEELKETLKKWKMWDDEPYEEIIWDLIEDRLELSKETLANIAEAEKDIAEGKVYTHKQVKEIFKLR